MAWPSPAMTRWERPCHRPDCFNAYAARPGHLSRHVREAVARTRRAMTMEERPRPTPAMLAAPRVGGAMGWMRNIAAKPDCRVSQAHEVRRAFRNRLTNQMPTASRG